MCVCAAVSWMSPATTLPRNREAATYTNQIFEHETPSVWVAA